MMSVSTAGAIDFRSDKERIAHSARLTKQEAKKQTRIMRESAKTQQQLLAAGSAPATTGPPAGWYADDSGMRWEWDGQAWTGRTASCPESSQGGEA